MSDERNGLVIIGDRIKIPYCPTKVVRQAWYYCDHYGTPFKGDEMAKGLTSALHELGFDADIVFCDIKEEEMGFFAIINNKAHIPRKLTK